MNVQIFETIKVPIMRLPFRSLEKKCHLDVAPTKNHRIYYREGSGLSSQRLWAMKS
jgi:hypothetical protein